MNTATTVELPQLSPEQMAELRKKFEAEKDAEKEQKKQYKLIVDSTVKELFTGLNTAADALASAKQKTFDDLEALLATKLEVYDVKDNQKTHTFTTADGNMRIVIGVKLLSGWDGTESAGVEKIKKYLTSLATDENSEKLSKIVLNLLRPDKNGLLNTNRVMELQKMKEEINNPLFTEGVEVIMAAYAPRDSAKFIEAYEKDANGNFKNVELRFAAIKTKLEDKKDEAA